MRLKRTKKPTKYVVSSKTFPHALGPYSQAVVANGFVFVAGQAPIDPKTQKQKLGDIKSETRIELQNIETILRASGSSLKNVVKVSIFLADLRDFDGMNQVYTEYFKDDYPVRTTVQAVLRTGRKIEIDCIGRVGNR
jgi:2-iminobutanoate/2-iminopropanoate deaminase